MQQDQGGEVMMLCQGSRTLKQPLHIWFHVFFMLFLTLGPVQWDCRVLLRVWKGYILGYGAKLGYNSRSRIHTCRTLDLVGKVPNRGN